MKRFVWKLALSFEKPYAPRTVFHLTAKGSSVLAAILSAERSARRKRTGLGSLVNVIASKQPS